MKKASKKKKKKKKPGKKTNPSSVAGWDLPADENLWTALEEMARDEEMASKVFYSEFERSEVERVGGLRFVSGPVRGPRAHLSRINAERRLWATVSSAG